MRTRTRLTAAAVATFTLTAGTVAAYAVNDARSRPSATGRTSVAPAPGLTSGDTPTTAGSRETSAPVAGSRGARSAGEAGSEAGSEKIAQKFAQKFAQRANQPWKPRGENYPKTVTLTNLPIKMDDGVVLRGDLILPADAFGKAVARKFPVVTTITAYNKSISILGGGQASYLVKRGYAQLTVDARGTGSSDGQWCAFCTREDADGAKILEWARVQPWSNGRTAMDGASYLGIAQIFAAAGRPAGLKAIFPQVPAADVYRDVVASGGQIDTGFMPLWLGLVNGTALIPPATPRADLNPLSVLTQHLIGAGTFSVPLLLQALSGQDPAFYGDFYKQRSPIEVISKVNVPTFLVSGEYDIFQRGTPLLFENLQRRGIPTKMVIGPWTHVQASGDNIIEAGYGTLDELHLRWFDHYVKGLPDPGLDDDIAPITYFEQGTGAWRTSRTWMGNRRAATYRLSGSSRTGGADGTLTTGTAKAGASTLLPIPVAGLCTRSTDQWTAGLVSMFPFPNPCNNDNTLNDRTGVVFKTAPLTKAVALQGPVAARLYASSLTGDGMLSVALEDEAPDGTVSRLTGGWQVISHRALDKRKSRYLDGKLIQPYHPFTKAAKVALAKGEVAPIDVELFPTGAKIRPGHRLRIAIQSFDVPHLLAPVPDLLSTLSVITLHTSAEYPSSLTIPVPTR
ncbi:MAG: hypothetical protein JWQ74_1083 [Marmoricola sp.]|nr:hypothetical protein [Marmoricola sp.]